METFSLKISEREITALSAIMERRGCSKADAARYAILSTASGKSVTEIEDKIDTVSTCVADLIRIVSAQFEIASAAENRIMRYAAQSAIFGGFLAANAGVKDEAMASYENWKLKQDGEK